MFEVIDKPSLAVFLVLAVVSIYAVTRWCINRLYERNREEMLRMDAAIASAHKRIDETEKRFLDIREALTQEIADLFRQQDVKFDKLESSALNQYHVLDQKIDVIKNHLISKGSPP